MPLRSCALTNERSARGVNKEGGTCRLTRVASGLEERGASHTTSLSFELSGWGSLPTHPAHDTPT